MAMPMDDILKISAWLSPAFPTGGFSYSQGLEWRIHEGVMQDGAELEAWIAGLLAHGSLHSDAVLFAASWHAARDAGELGVIAELAAALSPTRERQLETLQQGDAFLEALAAWPPVPECPKPCAYPVAAGAAFGLHGVALEAALTGFLNAAVTTLISVAVRLVPLGQKQGLETLAALQPRVVALVGKAAESTLEDLGGMGLASDIASMRHETQISRVFRS